MAGGVHGRGHVWKGGYVWRVCVCKGACVAGGVHGRGACVTGKTAIAVGSTHPTGMHSCFGMRWIISSQNISCE